MYRLVICGAPLRYRRRHRTVIEARAEYVATLARWERLSGRSPDYADCVGVIYGRKLGKDGQRIGVEEAELRRLAEELVGLRNRREILRQQRDPLVEQMNTIDEQIGRRMSRVVDLERQVGP